MTTAAFSGLTSTGVRLVLAITLRTISLFVYPVTAVALLLSRLAPDRLVR